MLPEDEKHEVQGFVGWSLHPMFVNWLNEDRSINPSDSSGQMVTAIDHMRELEKNAVKDMDYLGKRYAHGIESLGTHLGYRCRVWLGNIIVKSRTLSL